MSAAARRAAERWFLDRGLPSVLTPRARLRAVWPRSAPALAGAAIVVATIVSVYLLTGDTRVVIEGEPTPAEWVVLAIIVLSMPLAALVGWLVARLISNRARAVASTVAVTFALVGEAVVGDGAGLIITALVVGLIVALTATGFGSVLGWAVRLTLSHLAAVGSLMVRALPVVLLTVLVFFNSPVWIMSATITRGRLWLALLFLGMIAAAFLISGTLDRAKPVLDAGTAAPTGSHAPATAPQTTPPKATTTAPGTDATLAGTPFATMPDPPAASPLTLGERINVLFVLVASQLTQILIVVAVTAAIFFVLGLILLSPELLAAWTRDGSRDGTLLGMTIPVPQALIQITLFLAALTFMYVSARSVGGGEYRSQFLDPLIEDLRLTLIARNRYRASVSRERAD
ncbi:MAG TPA: hypothetical protein VMU34_19590 [Mycobacterium sp.]|nr:hypothetical protein [Mycobacterium sp.]